MMNFGHAHIVALQLPHAKQLAQAACDHAMQQWSSTKPLLATLGAESPLSLTLARAFVADALPSTVLISCIYAI